MMDHQSWGRFPRAHQDVKFLRWRVTFDITADGSQLSPATRRPVVQRVEVHADF